MTNYHINPETGEPGICRATKKCRFGEMTAHYATADEARQAYEIQMQIEERKWEDAQATWESMYS
jgi:hypothetical protein